MQRTKEVSFMKCLHSSYKSVLTQSLYHLLHRCPLASTLSLLSLSLLSLSLSLSLLGMQDLLLCGHC